MEKQLYIISLFCCAIGLTKEPVDIFVERANTFKEKALEVGLPEQEIGTFVTACGKFYRLGHYDDGYVCICAIDNILRGHGLDYLYQQFNVRKLNEQPYAESCAAELERQRRKHGILI